MQLAVFSYRVHAPEICNAFQMSDSLRKYQSRHGRRSSLFRKHQSCCPRISEDSRLEKGGLTPVHSSLQFYCTVITLNHRSQHSLARQSLHSFLLETTHTFHNPPATLRADQTGNTAFSTVGDQHAFVKANDVRNRRCDPF